MYTPYQAGLWIPEYPTPLDLTGYADFYSLPLPYETQNDAGLPTGQLDDITLFRDYMFSFVTLFKQELDLFPELGLPGVPNPESLARVENQGYVRYRFTHYINSTPYASGFSLRWALGYVTFNNVPFMIITNTPGNENRGRSVKNRYISNVSVFQTAISYLFSLLVAPVPSPLERNQPWSGEIHKWPQWYPPYGDDWSAAAAGLEPFYRYNNLFPRSIGTITA